MTSEIITSSFREERRLNTAYGEALRVGLYAGVAGTSLALVGAYVVMNKRFIIEPGLTLAQAIMACIALVAGAAAARAAGMIGEIDRSKMMFWGAFAGLVGSLCVAGLVVLITVVDMRHVLIAASPMLARELSFGAQPGTIAAVGIVVAIGTAISLVGALLAVVVVPLRRALEAGLIAVLSAGLFRDLFAGLLVNLEPLGFQTGWIFGSTGVRPVPGLVIFLATMVVSLTHSTMPSRRDGKSSSRSRTAWMIAFAVILVVLPLITNSFIAQVLMVVGLYILMSMGLNIELGRAGLVDLGFVAFYAVGAYTVALLCSDDPFAIANISFWIALPIAIALSAVAGFLFGLPVLRVRGDYLAMATLGLGEIVRVLVVSEAAKPLLGGAQGIAGVQRAAIFSEPLTTTGLYFLALALAALVGFISYRLQYSRVGRAWVAVREDEDVAQALGIDLVATKLLAYTIGAAFAGAAGAVYATLVGAVFPHTFQLAISINLVAILVIGGLGSLPGVVVGSLALIALPEMLREFGEFRYLFYGLAVVAIIHFKPEGLWPVQSGERAK